MIIYTIYTVYLWKPFFYYIELSLSFGKYDEVHHVSLGTALIFFKSTSRG